MSSRAEISSPIHDSISEQLSHPVFDLIFDLISDSVFDLISGVGVGCTGYVMVGTKVERYGVALQLWHRDQLWFCDWLWLCNRLRLQDRLALDGLLNNQYDIQ